MTARPKIAPAAAAALVAQIPSRLIKKLDADPALATRWTWARGAAGWAVTTDKGETVSLATVDDVVRAAPAVACSCLLSPRCLHVGAVVHALEPTEADDAIAADGARELPVEAAATAPAGFAPAQARAAEHAFAILAEVLAAGAAATGAFAQAELLRAIHGCRDAGLYRLAAAQTRVLRSIRELRADRPEFSLAVLAADLRDALAVAHAIGRGELAPALVGSARRDYEAAGSLRLRGLFTEAIVARSGHAGAVTYLIDDSGAIYTRADVAPGDAGRAAGAYDAAAGIGDAVLPHRELGRCGLFVSDATASADGRLGAGQRVRAVRASEPSRWDRAPLAERWAAPLAAQLAAIADHDAAPEALRPAGWDLVFVDGTLVAHASGLALVVGELALAVTTALDHRALAARDNLAVLARAPGLRVRAIGRVRIGAPRRLDLLALAPAADEPRLQLPDAWHGRANLHFDKLAVPSTGGQAARAVAAALVPVDDDLLAPLARRVDRVVEGGLATLPTHAIAELDREAALLVERALAGGADALRELAATAHDAARAMTGARRPVDRPRFARAWLRAALYDDVARRTLAIASWG